jgi:hypothetical protein
MKCYVGIDPGKSGGLVCLDRRYKVVALDPMPTTERDIWGWFQDLPVDVVAIIEKVHSMPMDSGRSMFTFGTGYGGLRMALTAAGVPFQAVPSRTWQKALSISSRKKSESKTQWKNRLKARAQELFHNEYVTLKTADALLIATYCRRFGK